VHHSVILELNIPSYRLEQAKKATDIAAGKEAEDSPDDPRPENRPPQGTLGNPNCRSRGGVVVVDHCRLEREVSRIPC